MIYKSNFWKSPISYVLIIAVLLAVTIYFIGISLNGEKGWIMVIAFSGCILYNLKFANFIVLSQDEIKIKNYFFPFLEKTFPIKKIEKVTFTLDRIYNNYTLKINIRQGNLIRSYALGYVRKEFLHIVINDFSEKGIKTS